MMRVMQPVLAIVALCAIGAAAAGGAETEKPTDTLAVKKAGIAKTEQLKFIETITEDKDGKPHLCLCRAMLFRMLQIAASERPNGVLVIDDIELVRTGWRSHASKEVLCDILGMPNDRLGFSDELPKADKSPKADKAVVAKACWEFRFADGKVVTLWATKTVLPEDFLKLRRKHKAGDKSDATKAALQARKKELVGTLSQVPLSELFVMRKGEATP